MGRQGARVLGAYIDAMTWSAALLQIEGWVLRKESRYVCVCNVHSVVTASQEAAYEQIINGADMATPDGTPIAWMLRRQGFPRQARINGPDLMWLYCQRSAQHGQSIYLYGGTCHTLELLQRKLLESIPRLVIAGAYSPPFRTLSLEEDAAIVEMINKSGAGVVWVSLGCPKQEIWMAAHRGRINAVMIGVGAAFDYHAGTIQRAPLWMQRHGLEWFHRLVTEPRRLWWRYLRTNSLFVIGTIRQLMGLK